MSGQGYLCWIIHNGYEQICSQCLFKSQKRICKTMYSQYHAVNILIWKWGSTLQNEVCLFSNTMRDTAVSANVIYPDIHVCVYVRDFMGTIRLSGNNAYDRIWSQCALYKLLHISQRKIKSILGCNLLKKTVLKVWGLFSYISQNICWKKKHDNGHTQQINLHFYL